MTTGRLLFLLIGGATGLSVFFSIFWVFVKCGLLCFGGGSVLVPVYLDFFVGPDAPYLQLAPEDFGNLLAITQMTPGPISINAATFFGYRWAGIAGSFVATFGLLFPSFILMTIALRSLERWKKNPVVQGLLWGVAPATIGMMVLAMLVFLEMSVFSGDIPWRFLFAGSSLPEGFRVRPLAVLLVAFSAWALYTKRFHIMTLVVICSIVGALLFPFLGS